MNSIKFKTGVMVSALFFVAISSGEIARGAKIKFESKSLAKAYTKYKSAVTRANTAYKKKSYECYCGKLKAMADIQQLLYDKLQLMTQRAQAKKDKPALANVEKWKNDLLLLQPLDMGEANDKNVEKYNARLARLDKKNKPRLDIQAGRRNIKIETARKRFLKVLDKEMSSAEKNNNYKQLKMMEACKQKVESAKNELPTKFPHIKPRVRYTLQIKAKGSLGLNLPDDIFNGCDESTYEIWICPSDISKGNFLWDGNDAASNDRLMGLKDGRVVSLFDEDDKGRKDSMRLLSKKELRKKKWYYLVFVNRPESVEIYINGKLDSRRKAKKLDHSDTSNLFLGCGRFGSKFWMDPYSGKIADVRIWRRALDGIEIFQAYHGLRPNKKSLIGEWNFSRGKPKSTVPRNVKATIYGKARLVKMRK